MYSTKKTPYPIVTLIAQHANLISAMVGLGAIILGLWAVLSGAPYWAGATYIGGGILGYFLLRSYGELAHILLDILMPND